MIDGEGYEITTFRKDGAYSDGRHPDSVEFTSDLEVDLSRRDFTINAMAYNNEEGLIDPFDGLYDIQNKVIRCVGFPEDRLNEDALRILRAIRFACQLDFSIDPSLGWCIGYTNIKDNLKNISVERINSEFCKMIVCNNFYDRLVKHYSLFTLIIPELKDMIDFKQNNPWHCYDVFLHTVRAIEHCDSDDLITKLAVFFHDFGKPRCYTDDKDGIRHFAGHGMAGSNIVKGIMKRLKFDNKTIKDVVQLVYFHDIKIDIDGFGIYDDHMIKSFLKIMGETQFRRLLDVKRADASAYEPSHITKALEFLDKVEKIFTEVISENRCYQLKDLAINGDDIKKCLGIKEGKKIGIYLNVCLSEVMFNEVENNKEDLLNFIANYTPPTEN